MKKQFINNNLQKILELEKVFDEHIDWTQLLADGIIKYDEVSGLMETMKQLKELKEKYGNQIKQRNDGRQYYVWVPALKKQIYATTMDNMWDKLYEIEYGLQGATLDTLFNVWIRESIKQYQKHQNGSSKTLEYHINNWKHYYAKYPIAQKRIRDITPRDFATLYHTWWREHGDLTKKNYCNIKSTINKILTHAICEEIITTNPAKELQPKHIGLAFREPARKKSTFSQETRTKLAKHYAQNDDVMYSLAACFGLKSGARVGEILALRWDHITETNITIAAQRVRQCEIDPDTLEVGRNHYEVVEHTKCHHIRTIPVTKDIQEILTAAKKLHPSGEFVFMKNGKLLYTNKLNEYIKKQCSKLKITPASSHQNRFSVATTLFTNGVPLTDIQTLLGHRDIQTTLSYVRDIGQLNTIKTGMEAYL